MKVLDLGCGTGTLTIMLKQAHPDADVTGLDGDPRVLDMARAKSRGMDIHRDKGLISFIPHPDYDFDRVSPASSFTTSPPKTSGARSRRSTAFSNRRANCICWIGAPHSTLAKFMVTYMRRLEETADNFDGVIPLFVTEAGFTGVEEAEHHVTIFGPLSLWRTGKG